MKLVKYFLAIIFISTAVFAQDGKPLSQWTAGSELAAGDLFFYTDVSDPTSGEAGTSKRIAFEVILANILSGNYSITGERSFTKAIGLPSLTNTTVANGFFLNSSVGRPAFRGADGTINNLVTTTDLNPFSLGDSSDVFFKSANNDVSGTNTYTGVEDYKNAVVYIPRVFGSIPDFSSGGTSQLIWSDEDSLFHYSAKNTENDKWHLKIPSLKYLQDRGFGSSGGWIPTTGSISSVNVNVSASAGTWTLYNLDPLHLFLSEDNTPATQHEITYSYTGAGINDGLRLNYGAGVMKMLNQTSTTNLIEEYLHYGTPTETEGTMTVSFLDNQVIGDIAKEGSEEVTITFTNYAAGRVANFWIADNTVSVTLSISGVSLSYGERSTPTYSDGAWYHIQMVGVTSTKCAVYVTRHDW